ncbi:MAG TPA: DUF4198 domain-containing protein [Sphingobium sp.]|uniref:DUF4198 domain-containing protein n=1 Tax=Sphingobium sp. TaxID=1912891 RepID=UPI002ED3AFD3
MMTSRFTLALVGLVAVALPLASASAHRQWILPSQTAVDDAGAYVTFDAAVSEGLFDFDSFPLKVEGLTVTGPDGQPVQPENVSAGKRRSTFDVKLDKPGTYRIAMVTNSAMGSYMLNGEQKRFRGSESEVPKDATDIRVTHMEGRIESFVSAGEPTATAIAPVGKGLEIVPVTNPTENIVGTPAKFRALVDGKPTPDIDVTIVPGGGRFRANLGDMTVKSDAKGEVTVNWPMAGMVWLGASWPPRPAGAEGGPGGQGGPGGGAGMGGGEGGPGQRAPQPPRRLSYAATYEVSPF